MLIEPYCKELPSFFIYRKSFQIHQAVLLFLFLVGLYLLDFNNTHIPVSHSVINLNSWASLETAAAVRINLCLNKKGLNKSVIRWAWSHSLTESGASCGRLNCPWMLPSGWIWVSSSLFVPLHGRSSFSPLSAFSASLHPLSLSVSGILCAWCSVLLSPSYSCKRRLSSEPESTLPPGGKGLEVLLINWDMSP